MFPKIIKNLVDGQLNDSNGHLNVLVFSDLHFMSKKSADDELFIKNFLKIINDGKDVIDFAVCLGDILNDHEKIDMASLNRAITLFENIISIIPLYILIGNHDRKCNSEYLTKESPFYALHHWNDDKMKGIKIIDNILLETIKNHKFIFVPYVPTGKFYNAILDAKIMLDNTTAIFAHQEFRGATASGHTSTSGDSWNFDDPLVISGHYHDLQNPADNIIYVGSIFQHRIDEDDFKGISVFQFYDDLTFKWFMIKDLIPPTIRHDIKAHEIDDIKNIKCDEKTIIVIDETGYSRNAKDDDKIQKLKDTGARVIIKKKILQLSEEANVRCETSIVSLMREITNEDQLLKTIMNNIFK